MKNSIIENSKILVIDDQPANLSILFDYLDMFNAEVMVEQDINIALELAETRPDIILLDIIMPDMNGFEFCEKLKENPKTKDIPVIFMSALNDTDNIVKGFQAGGVDYIVKPVRQEEVIARITTHLKIVRTEKELREKEKNESMAVITGGVAHTFNNILAGILGFAELALYDLENKAHIKNSLEQILKSGRFAAEIIKKMLSYACGEKGVLKDKTNLSQMIKNIGPLVELAISGDCPVNYDLMEELPLIKADSNLVNQMLLNLVINSSEAKEQNKVTITIRTGRQNDDYIYLEVEDNGSGIEDANLNKIFDPFFTTKFLGRGLGLAVVKGIVKTHNGIIEVKSQVGKGTSIKVLFPVKTKEYSSSL